MNLYIVFLLSIVFSFVCAYVAKKRSRNQFLWFFLGLFFTFFALIFLLILPPLGHDPLKDEAIQADLKEIEELENTENHKEDKDKFPADIPNKMWYYLDKENQQYGPMSIDALMDDWKNGKIKSDTYVWNEDLTDWKPLKETSDFQLFQTRKKFN